MLTQPTITFDAGTHTYTNKDGVLLTSVTTMLKRQLFADMYDGIPQRVLEAAAEHGTAIHAEIEEMDKTGCEPTTEYGTAYRELKGSNLALANEYLVANDTHAGTIDCVWVSETGKMVLADIKTTSKLHDAYVTWQLSVYAYLLEHCNPGRTIDEMYCVWLPKQQYGKPTLKKLDRIPSETIEALLLADAQGEQFVVPEQYAIAEVAEEPLPAQYADVEDQLVQALQYINDKKSELKMLEAQRDELNNRLLVAMEENGIKKWQTDRITITYKAPSKRDGVDVARLKKEYPEAFDACYKPTNVKSSLSIKLK